MAINALIAEGVQPIGRDLPQIANMLQQRQQQQFQNSLATNQDARAKAELDMRMRAESDAKKTEDAKRGYAAASRLETVPPEQLSSAINSPGFEFIAEGLRKQGIDPTTADPGSLKQFVGNLKNATGSYLGVGPVEPTYKGFAAGENIYRMPTTPGGVPELVGSVPNKPTGNGTGFGNVNPGEFTPASLAKYQQTHNYADLVRNPTAPAMPNFQNVTRTMPDGSTQMGTFDHRTGTYKWGDNPVVPAGTAAAANAAGRERGKVTTDAQMDLPRVVDNAKQSIASIDSLLNDKSAGGIFGLNSMLPIIPGSPRARAQAKLDQIKGKTFLEAYNTLRGGGQITEVEGEKATAAIARLNQAQSWKDAQPALQDLKGVITAGLVRAQKKASPGAAPTGKTVDFRSLP